MGRHRWSVECAFAQWTSPMSALGLRGIETARDVKDCYAADQQRRTRRHFADEEFVVCRVLRLLSSKL